MFHDAWYTIFLNERIVDASISNLACQEPNAKWKWGISHFFLVWHAKFEL
jgi:hypothetical protein